MILLDADSLLYKVGFSTQEESEKIAISRISTMLEEIIFTELHTYEDYKVFLSGSENYRKEIDPQYKANRVSEKPKHYDILKEYVLSAWAADLSAGNEADDQVCIAAYELGVNGCIIAHIDKDLDQIPGKHYNYNKKEFYEVDEYKAALNFYTQILTGDRVDNVIGIAGIGPKKAAKLLADCKTEGDMYAACSQAYKGDSERLIRNARLLHLQRKRDDEWQPPV
jgi:5'-3' exonuclease